MLMVPRCNPSSCTSYRYAGTTSIRPHEADSRHAASPASSGHPSKMARSASSLRTIYYRVATLSPDFARKAKDDPTQRCPVVARSDVCVMEASTTTGIIIMLTCETRFSHRCAGMLTLPQGCRLRHVHALLRRWSRTSAVHGRWASTLAGRVIRSAFGT